MEFCEGSFIADKQFYKDNNVPVQEVISNLGKLYSEMIFVKGFIHCDPHPGNLLVNKVNGKAVIVLLDHGLYQSLHENIRLDYCNLWMSLINGDNEGLKKYSTRLGVAGMYPLLACVLTGRSWNSLKSGLNAKYSDREDAVVRESAPVFFQEINQILNKIPRPLLLILKTNDLIRGLERSLNCRPGMASFAVMSKACSTALLQNKLNTCQCIWHGFYYKSVHLWHMFKLSVAMYCIKMMAYLGRLKRRSSSEMTTSFILT